LLPAAGRMLRSGKPLASSLRASPAGRAQASHIEEASGVPVRFVIQRLSGQGRKFGDVCGEEFSAQARSERRAYLQNLSI